MPQVSVFHSHPSQAIHAASTQAVSAHVEDRHIGGCHRLKCQEQGCATEHVDHAVNDGHLHAHAKHIDVAYVHIDVTACGRQYRTCASSLL